MLYGAVATQPTFMDTFQMQKDTTAPIFKPYWLGERSPAEPVILEPENTWKTTPASGIARSKSDWSLAIPLSPVIGLGVGVYSVLANEIRESFGRRFRS